ncbi:MAG: hypothetical protein F6K25_19985 [Okeania sp. SIO2G4]|nr:MULTISPECIES: hypothetical protein [unclassified Okeania]NEP04458.1 hypothetical protein [Okeania sp. SIO4D6]NEP74110.1 hypothetical protein [Okeania sp. SIO2G5]NEP95054.1 hypothetical protein [Okeania sp. SIO2F5]NEQ92825.1 hypothetical protein [Okeania sp. SIO2G4]
MNELSILNNQAIATLPVSEQDYWTIIKLILKTESSGVLYLVSFRA